MSAERVHVAGAPSGTIQKCAECGAVLVDHSSGPITGEGGRIVEARPLFFQAGAKLLEVRDGLKVQTHSGTPTTCGGRG